MAKVNDADGNPIEIAAVVVWQVRDTAQALYAVDDYPQLRGDPDRDGGPARGLQLSLQQPGGRSCRCATTPRRSPQRLSAEIAARVASAGVHIIESRLTRLSYAPEIAQAMLRQQQASAVVGARRRIVEGAVGMVSSR